MPDEPIDLGVDGFPVDEAAGPVPVALRAAAVAGSGTAKWATKNIGTKWEYQQDCTNFVSKALYYGGKMKTRSGGRKHDRAWWQQYTCSARSRTRATPGQVPRTSAAT
ncbi:hypothetical protein HFP43_32135 [Streptomyces sp. SJ1-7]|nr:hypothetical protein [Streptomyces sp. SJ1-7]